MGKSPVRVAIVSFALSCSAAVLQKVYSIVLGIAQCFCKDYGIDDISAEEHIQKCCFQTWAAIGPLPWKDKQMFIGSQKRLTPKCQPWGAFLFQVTEGYCHLHKVWKLDSHCAFNDKGISWAILYQLYVLSFANLRVKTIINFSFSNL